MIDAQQPESTAVEPDLIGSVAIPIDANTRLDSLELRTRNLEAQHAWLRVEQLDAQVQSLAKVVASLVDRDGGAGA